MNRKSKYASGSWHAYLLPKRITIGKVRIHRWLNFFWRWKGK